MVRDTWDDRAGVEGEDGRVRVDRVRVEDFGEGERGDDGLGEVRCEGVFVRTTTIAWALQSVQSAQRETDLVYLRAFATDGNS